MLMLIMLRTGAALLIHVRALQPVNGFVVAAFKPASPPTIPTPDAVWQGISQTGADFSWSVPSFIEVCTSACVNGRALLMAVLL